VIAHPHGKTPVDLSLLLIGGPVLFLAAQAWYLRVVPRVSSNLHFIGGGALFLVGLGTLVVPPYAALILAGVSLATLAVVDQKWGAFLSADLGIKP
jgi:low temperature requirement protein LtrA